MARRRYELSDEQFDRIEDLLPSNEGQRGRPFKDHRPVINGIFWILGTGAPWRDLPERYGAWKTVYDRFRTWSDDGTLQRIVDRLQADLDEDGEIDWELFCIDGSTVPASRAAAGGPEDDKKGIETTETSPV